MEPGVASNRAIACVLAWQDGHGGSKPGRPQLAQREQSLPGVSGQGKQEQPSGPMALQLSCALSLHELGVDAVSFVPASQHGPRPVGGIGIRDHIDPGGVLFTITSNLSEQS